MVHITHNNFAGYNGISIPHYNAINRVCSEAAREIGYRRIEIRSAIHGTTTYYGPDSSELAAPWGYYNIVDPFGMHVTVNFDSDPDDLELLEPKVLHVYVRRRNWTTGLLEHIPRNIPSDFPFEEVEYLWTSEGPPDKDKYTRCGIEIDDFVTGYPNNSPSLVDPSWRPAKSPPIRSFSTPLTEGSLMSATPTEGEGFSTQYISQWLDSSQETPGLGSKARTLEWDPPRSSPRIFRKKSNFNLFKRVILGCFLKQDEVE